MEEYLCPNDFLRPASTALSIQNRNGHSTVLLRLSFKGHGQSKFQTQLTTHS
jgi:hypothetical protein